jgi:alkylation response protein AidB-like acyl-CoA dehydrogenase
MTLAELPTQNVQGVNRYRAELREMEFVLFEQFRYADLLGKAPFAAWDEESVRAVLGEMHKLATEVLGPLNPVGDRLGCRLDDGQVYTPPGYKAAWKKLYEGGWKQLGVPEEHGGQGAPMAVSLLVDEMINGGCTAFGMYSGLATGVADVIAAFGTPEQKETYVEALLTGKLGGSMCLTEPHAGSDVGMARSTAKKRPDGQYDIRGSKIFISGGDHDLADNIIHLVLARIDGAPAGTKGLSLFIVPKVRDGESNDVSVAGIEHKMGLNGSSTAQLNFGENDGCVGELVGTIEHNGMQQMFKLMNYARIGTGLQGLALASSAYLNALDYSYERKQGSSMKAWKDPNAPRVPIVEHPDVRRMLLDMKSRVEGIRALLVKLSWHIDQARAGEGDAAKVAYHKGQVDLLTPLAKAYGSDQGFQVCITAIQTFGGAGYLKDHPVEQYARDAKVFSIYEGTNHIQAMDLVGRKLGQNGGANAQAFLGDIAKFVAENKSHPQIGKAVEELGRASEALGGTVMQLLGWFQAGKMEMVPLAANRFLEMASETVVGWLLLDQARIAADKDDPFYKGKVQSALYFARNVLPAVKFKAELIAREDDSPMKAPF